MTKGTFLFKRVQRFPRIDVEDELVFEPGVNVIVGKPNTGKTKWLSMIDFLMGERKTAAQAFGVKLAAKYSRIQALVEINGKEVVLERRWKERNIQSKVLVDERAYDPDKFSDYLLSELGIPILKIPKANPTSGKWPTLSWRTLLRHIYRQQRGWESLAEKTYDADQAACVMQFLGLAELVFPSEQGDLQGKYKELSALQSKKEAFSNALTEIAGDLLDESQASAQITEEELSNEITAWEERFQNSLQRREEALQSWLTAVNEQQDASDATDNSSTYEQYSEKLAQLRTALELNFTRRSSFESRIAELKEYKSSIQAELNRLLRAKTAGLVFNDLKVTNCPVCDQEVQEQADNPDHCFLCHKPWSASTVNQLAVEERLAFEIKQLEGEVRETSQLIETGESDLSAVRVQVSTLQQEITQIESLLTPLRQSASALMPSQISIYDMELGAAQERIRSLQRLKSVFRYRDELSKQIDILTYEIQQLTASMKITETPVNFEQRADLLSDGMNLYLRTLRIRDEIVWNQGAITVDLKRDQVNIRVGPEEWSNQLGGTFVLYFMLAYNFGLHRLSNTTHCHYPGLTILDLPATFEQTSVTDIERYITKPFIDLVAQPDKVNTQVIISGHEFSGIEGVNIIELNEVWQPDATFLEA